ncbi:hypothetical protein HELRODRAFT_174608 [Helobdella robusta]|uniref:Fibrinogen C-terminal domain-containing protein n=1 Tax=Helobdella robusta TaxID=6412 RepID=T1F8A8_HELRO|nr:hypothetical protein HELRODRAFT_174608 [Helobdella robusta]ESO01649.1 hypothetical protein HELRODRAFT_174608 [Helobdella robusta]
MPSFSWLISVPDKNYHRHRDTKGNSLCFNADSALDLRNIRSLIECSLKCSQFNSLDNKFGQNCNAINYIGNKNEANKLCQLLVHRCDVNYFIESPSDVCSAFEDVQERRIIKSLREFCKTNFHEILLNDKLSKKFCLAAVGSAYTNEIVSLYPLVFVDECIFPVTFKGGLFYACSNALPEVENICFLPMCLDKYRRLSVCLNPYQSNLANETVSLRIPNSKINLNVVKVNRWIVIQQRISNLTSFNQSWETYKNDFGKFDRNFWLGLENIHQLTSSANYSLRLEVCGNGYWVSDEYDHFMVNSAEFNYSLNVSNYNGDNFDVLNIVPTNLPISQGHNGRMFSTFDRDNTPLQRSTGMHMASGNWFDGNSYAQNLNGVYDVNFQYYVLKFGRLVDVQYCRMMIKLFDFNLV